MDYSKFVVWVWIFICGFEKAYSLSLSQLLAIPPHSNIRRSQRQTPTNSFANPPSPELPFPANPLSFAAPYPLPATQAPAPRIRKVSRFIDSSNPYLDAMTDSYYPNYGFGFLYQQPTILNGGIAWPTGNVAQPQDQFSGNLGVVRPVQLRFGTQGGPFFPWQDARFVQTARDIQEANLLAYRTQLLQRYAVQRTVQEEEALVIPQQLPQRPSPLAVVPQRRRFDQPYRQSFGAMINRRDPMTALFGRR